MNPPTDAGLKKLGELLKYHRNKHNLTLRKAAERAEIQTGDKFSFSTISDLERGKTSPTIKTFTNICAAGYVPYTPEQLMAIACGEPVPEEIEMQFEVKVLPRVLPKTAEEAIPYLLALPTDEKLQVARKMLEAV